MSNKGRKPRDSLDSRGNRKMGKSISKGFGVVRFLTNPSQQEVFRRLDEAEIDHESLRRRPPLHLTVLGFVSMTTREQRTFNAGMNVKRLEERLEEGVAEKAPRTSLPVELGEIATIENFIYAVIEDPRITLEQLQIAGQVALHGIRPRRIHGKAVPPHVGIGHGQVGPIEALRERVEEAIKGQSVALQRWDVYPERYA